MNDALSNLLIHRVAQNYLRCLASFPPSHLPDMPGEIELQLPALREGLCRLHEMIENIYQIFTCLPVRAEEVDHWSDEERCWKTIEEPIKLLWALGTRGEITVGESGSSLWVNKSVLEEACKARGVKRIVDAMTILKGVGLSFGYLDEDAAICPAGYKACAAVSVCASGADHDFWQALKAYASCFQMVKDGLPFEIFLRADFRPLLPGYQVKKPHIPLDEEEVTRTIDLGNRELWYELINDPNQARRKERLFYRVPILRKRWWTTDFSTTGKDYGLWSVISNEEGIHLRLVFKKKGYHTLLDQIDLLTPRYQEIYLNCVACHDCVHCGKHIDYPHGDHTHRLCQGSWFYSPPIQPEDLPDIRKLIQIHLTNLK